MHGGDVVNRLGHHPRQFLEARETVEFQGIERLRRGLGGFNSRTHLGFAVKLDVSQLSAQTLQVFSQIGQRALDLRDARFNARPGNADLARLVDQLVQHRSTHAHGRLRALRPLGHFARGTAMQRKAGPVHRRKPGWWRRCRYRHWLSFCPLGWRCMRRRFNDRQIGGDVSHR